MNRKYSKYYKEKIIKMHKEGASKKWLAREKGIDRHDIQIWIGREEMGKSLELKSGKRISEREKEEIRTAIERGLSNNKISIMYDISRSSVLKIKRGMVYGEEKEERKDFRRSTRRECAFKGREFSIKGSSSVKKNDGRRGVAAGIESLRKEYKLKVLLKEVEISRSTFYYHRKKLREEDKYEGVKLRIAEIHKYHKGRYGYRRITEILHKEGREINHKTVLRLMKELGLKNVVKRVRYRSYRGVVGKKAGNIIEREFKAEKPNEKWATDITQVNIKGEKLYLSPIQDMFNGEIVSYKISKHPDIETVKGMLREACKKVGDTRGIILHSDQGWHYQHYVYHKILKEQGIVASMSRKGNCLDNAKMESFFGMMKKELLYAKEYENIETFKKDLVEYISYYNHERIKIELNGLSPVQYRTKWLEQHSNL